jgi:polyisoprenoid-binding protein YceI
MEEMTMKTAGMTGLVASLALALASAGAQSKEFKIDAAHSDANFAIKHMAISTVHGSIRGVSGVIQFDPADLSKSGVEATIDVSKVDTGVAQRDTHLKSPDFFDVAKFPTMTFKSTSIAKTAGGFAVTGNLTLHGVTKPVVLALEAPGKAEPDAKGAIHRGFTATTTLNRKDFGLVWSNKTPGGDAIVGDDVKIELDIEAVAAS